jgi:hypothetical protein
MDTCADPLRIRDDGHVYRVCNLAILHDCDGKDYGLLGMIAGEEINSDSKVQRASEALMPFRYVIGGPKVAVRINHSNKE